MRRGIHRGLVDDNGIEHVRRAWVAEAPGGAGEWLTESEYVAQGYVPAFGELPVMRIIRSGPFLASIDDLPEVDREFVRQQMERKNA